MWPTYAGMTAEVYAGAEAPGKLKPATDKFRYWANYTEIKAPSDGELYIDLSQPKQVQGRNSFYLPTTKGRYTLYIGNAKMEVDVPLDFDFRDLFRRTFYPERKTLTEMAHLAPKVSRHGKRLVASGHSFKKGETIMAYEIRTGDMLFVDRFSYHFWPPEVGDPFVFRTGKIKTLDDKYYIKRLVGQGGDTLRVQNNQLLRNDQPIEGAPSFARNNSKQEPYEGYYAFSENQGYLENGAVYKPQAIPGDHYVAMGDNSLNSLDSRMWGYVPQDVVVGKATFIFYPFSSRWGLAE